MRILIVIPHDTLLGPQGARRRLDGLLEMLRGTEVAFLLPESTSAADRASVPGRVSFFREPAFGGRSIPYLLDCSRGWLGALEEAVRTEAPEIVIFNFPWGLASASKRVQVPLVYFSHGIERDFAPITLRHLGLNFAPLRFAFQKFIGSLEQAACRAASLVIAMSENDARRYGDDYGCENVHVLPQPFEAAPPYDRSVLRAKLDLPLKKRVIVFHGSYSHLPNREAIEHIRRYVAPLVLDAVPDCEFFVAGKDVPEFVEPGIRSVGFVENLSEFVAACDLAVVPVTSGCGVRMKLFDYFAAGVPCVSTEKGAEGLPLRDGRELLLTGNGMEEFSRAVIRALNDDILRRSLRENAKEYLRVHHEPGKLADELKRRLSCVERRSPSPKSRARLRQSSVS